MAGAIYGPEHKSAMEAVKAEDDILFISAEDALAPIYPADDVTEQPLAYVRSNPSGIELLANPHDKNPLRLTAGGRQKLIDGRTIEGMNSKQAQDLAWLALRIGSGLKERTETLQLLEGVSKEARHSISITEEVYEIPVPEKLLKRLEDSPPTVQGKSSSKKLPVPPRRYQP